MTKAHKARVLYSILELEPMVRSKPDFKRYADSGNLDGLWTYFQNSLRARAEVRRSVESSGEVGFEMLRPAMEAIYSLPTTD
jgi:hypothetical protein